MKKKLQLNDVERKIIEDHGTDLIKKFNDAIGEKGLSNLRVGSFTIVHANSLRCCAPDETPVLIVGPDGKSVWSCQIC